MSEISKNSLPDLGEKLKQAMIMGDLSKLSAVEKVQYYQRTCDSLGLNHLTKPFAYIRLQGKETLYATKNATDQLRKIYGVSIVECEQNKVGDLLVVTVKAQDGAGKTDIDVGALPIGHLKGESLSNAMMKAVTKAKRRVTLSICGLGMLDETEIESIPGAQQVRDVQSTPKTMQQIVNRPINLEEDYPRDPKDVEKGPYYLYIKGKFRGQKNNEIDIEEMSQYFDGYLRLNLEKQGGSFKSRDWQETYERMKDWIENYHIYQDVIAEIEEENEKK